MRWRETLTLTLDQPILFIDRHLGLENLLLCLLRGPSLHPHDPVGVLTLTPTLTLTLTPTLILTHAGPSAPPIVDRSLCVPPRSRHSDTLEGRTK